MAMACLRLFTVLPLRPLLSVPRLLRIERSTSFDEILNTSVPFNLLLYRRAKTPNMRQQFLVMRVYPKTVTWKLCPDF